MNTNSENPRVGKTFQIAVQHWFEETLHMPFKMEQKIAIGNPAKLHSFDIASLDGNIVIECKCYTWTESGNVPSAKMGFTNEAAFYLSFLPKETDKAIVMLKATHPRRSETLAEYYFRTNRHLLGNIKVCEFDPNIGTLSLVGQNKY
jgi:hypothetical protein